MKKLLLIIFLGLIISGCTDENTRKKELIEARKSYDKDIIVTEIEYDNHSYLSFSYYLGTRYGTASFVHNPECPCFKDKTTK